MSVRVRVPTPLRRFTAGSEEVAAAGESIKSVIEDLERNHPGLRERLLDDTCQQRAGRHEEDGCWPVFK